MIIPNFFMENCLFFYLCKIFWIEIRTGLCVYSIHCTGVLSKLRREKLTSVVLWKQQLIYFSINLPSNYMLFKRKSWIYLKKFNNDWPIIVKRLLPTSPPKKRLPSPRARGQRQRYLRSTSQPRRCIVCQPFKKATVYRTNIQQQNGCWQASS